MSKIKKISGAATSLGVASAVALASWHVPSLAQEAAPATKAAAPAAQAAPEKKPAASPATKTATDKKASPEAKTTPQAAQTNHQAKPVRAKDDESSKAGAPKKESGDAEDSKKKGPKGKHQPVGRADAIEHYRQAQKALMEVEHIEDPKSESAAEARKARREAMRELRRARDEILRSHNQARRAFQKRDPEEVEALRKQVAKHTAQLRKDRKERAEKNRADVAQVVGEDPLHPSVREELRNHAWRIARLNQIIYLAELDKKEKLAEKAKELIEKEKASHDERLKGILTRPEVKNYKPKANASDLKARPKSPSKLPAGHPPLPTKTAKPAPQAPQPAGDQQ